MSKFLDVISQHKGLLEKAFSLSGDKENFTYEDVIDMSNFGMGLSDYCHAKTNFIADKSSVLVGISSKKHA
jgi:hypothetical protein